MNALGWVNRLIGELSGGERQRVLLARALAVKAEIFLMDEPLANLDPSHQSDCLNLIRSLTHEGKTVITVLHEVSFALNADEVIVMESGNLIAHSKAQDFKLHRVIETVFNDRISIQPLGDQFVITMNYKTTYKSESNSYGN
jgi:iron complex transport system ATP-binding protein